MVDQGYPKGEHIGSVAGIHVYENTKYDGAVTVDNGQLKADELREMADMVDDYYSEPDFVDVVESIDDEFEGIEIASSSFTGRYSTVKLLFDDDSIVGEVVEKLNEVADYISVNGDSIFAEKANE